MAIVPVGKSQLVLQSEGYSPLGRITRAAFLHVTERTGLKAARVTTNYGLIYILRGEGIYEDERTGPRPVAAGDLIMVFPAFQHRYSPGKGQEWDEFFLAFGGPVFSLWQKSGLLNVERPVMHLHPVEHWLPKMQALAEPGPEGDSSYTLRQVCALQLFLCETQMTTAKQHDYINSFERSLVKQAGDIFSQRLEERMTPRDVAKSVGVSYDTLRRSFKRVLGVSPGRFRAERTLHHAAELLSEGKLMNKEIATRLGFSDEFHFSKRFHSVIGCSPRTYRRLRS